MGVRLYGRSSLWAFIRAELRQLVLAGTNHLPGFSPDQQPPQKGQLARRDDVRSPAVLSQPLRVDDAVPAGRPACCARPESRLLAAADELAALAGRRSH
jgi:hypothetical protein